MSSFQHIRNACGKLHYAGKVFLIDPMLAAQGAYPGFPGTPNSELYNPLGELPVKVEEILDSVDAVIVTHTHIDHWDPVAAEVIPKHLPMFVQHEADAALIRGAGFTDVRVVDRTHVFEGVTINRTEGVHGTCDMYAVPQIADFLGHVMGVVLQADNLPTVYFAGDSIWGEYIDQALTNYNPDYIVVNSGDAKLLGFEGSLLMGKKDVLKACQVAPKAKIIAVHMESLNHCALSRQELREFTKEKDIVARVFVPENGETVKL